MPFTVLSRLALILFRVPFPARARQLPCVRDQIVRRLFHLADYENAELYCVLVTCYVSVEVLSFPFPVTVFENNKSSI